MEPYENNENEVTENEEQSSLETVEEDKPVRVKIDSLHLEERFEDGIFVKLGAAVGLGYLIARGIGWVGKKTAAFMGRAVRSWKKAFREDKEAEKERKAEAKRKIKEQSEEESSKVDGEPVEQEIIDKNGKTVKSNRK